MLIDFFFHLRAAKLKVSINELLTLLEAIRRDVIGPSIDEFYYLSRATLIKDETQFDKFDRAFGEYFRGVTHAPGLREGDSRRVVQAGARARLHPRGDREAREARLGQADGGVQEAARGAGRRAPRRQPLDRLGRHVAVRPRRRASRGHPRRRTEQGRQVGGEGVGDARLPRLRRHRRTRHAQHQGRAAPPAPLRARRRRPRARPARHDRVDREERRLARPASSCRSGTTP